MTTTATASQTLPANPQSPSLAAFNTSGDTALQVSRDEVNQVTTAAKVEYLVPPIISRETIQENIVCTRPMRDGKFNISMEEEGGKTIFNCYGHGGSGWTTLFGSVNKIIKCFVATNPNKKLPIKVIGAGCMGLTTAIELARLGYQVCISAKSFIDCPSLRAAGYFALVSVQTSPEEQEELNQIGMDTFLTYQQIEQGDHPYITKEAVRYLPVYCSEDTESGLEDLEAKGIIPKRELVTLDFGNGVRHENFYKYMTYFLNTTTLMKQLHEAIDTFRVLLLEQNIEAIDQISESVVFNCAGLGGRELRNDDKMIPVYGHLQTFNAKAGDGHMQYMIYTKVKQGEEDEYVYLFPKDMSVTLEHPDGIACAAVSGGTFKKFADKLQTDVLKGLHQREFEKLQDRSSQFFHGHPFRV